MTDEDWTALRFEAGQYFTPSMPVGVAELFAGRAKQLVNLIDTVAERGRHAIIYGEPGVGKTSIAQIIQYMIPNGNRSIRYIRKPVFSTHTYSSLWIEIFREIKFVADVGEGEREYSIADLYQNGVTPADVVRELSYFSESDIPIIVIDEYNLFSDPDISHLMAETVKAVSDASINATIIIVGTSDNVTDLIHGHSSILRCSEEVPMPRMTSSEMQELLVKRVKRLGMKLQGDAKWKIINLCKGLPAFAQHFGKASVISAINSKTLNIIEDHVDDAIDAILESSQHTLKNDYETATNSNQQKATFKQLLTACALAPADESGYFVPAAVQQPFSAIMKRTMGIDAFNKNLKQFASSQRGNVLQMKGTDRLYRFRFRNPAMQPFAIMKGIKAGFLDESAKSALSSPEQSDLFANES